MRPDDSAARRLDDLQEAGRALAPDPTTPQGRLRGQQDVRAITHVGLPFSPLVLRIYAGYPATSASSAARLVAAACTSCACNSIGTCSGGRGPPKTAPCTRL